MIGLGVQLRDVRHTYDVDGDITVALTGATLSVEGGETVGILGPSGSGKSTLLTLLAGLTRPVSGAIHIGARDVTSMTESDLLRMRGTEVGMVVQGPARNLLGWSTVADNVRFAQRAVPRRDRRGLPTGHDLLGPLGMASLLPRRVDQLSGGESQRLAIALGVAAQPGLLLLDEPTSQLDHVNRDRVLDVVLRINTTAATTVIAVTHDPDVAAALDRTVTVAGGVLTEPASTVRHVTVTPDGSVRLAADLLPRWRPGTDLTITGTRAGVELRPRHPPA